jgi:uncharacterized protein (TIGR03435 family)
MYRFVEVTASGALVLLTCAAAVAQPRLAFEVVSIKPAPEPTPAAIQSGAARLAFNIDGARVEIVGYRPSALLWRAFRVEPQQVDARASSGSDTFEIQAKLPAGATPEQVPEMLQTMLIDRFKLAYHRETREYQLTVLSVGKSGMKLPRLPDDTKESTTSTRLSDGSSRMIHTGKVTSLFPVMNSFGGFRQMVDETGLDGVYTWVQEMPSPSAGVSYQDAEHESFIAMLEAAGLKLETRKVSKETIVVDHLEKTPTEN